MRRTDRRDPLGYRPGRQPEAPTRAARPLLRAPRTARRLNRRNIPPAVLWNRRLRALRNWLMLVLVLEIAWLGYTSPLMLVRRVIVEGGTVRRPAEIARIAGLTQPVNILRIRTRKAARKLEALPEVASARIDRRYPRTLVVVIRERKTVAALQTAAGTWLIDPDGKAFRPVPGPPPRCTVLYAPLPAPVVLGRPIPMPALKPALQCLAAVSDLPLHPPVRFHVTAEGEAWLDSPDNLKIRLGPLDSAPSRLEVTIRLLKGPDGPQILKKAAVLDMTSPMNENYTPRANTPDYRITPTR